MENEFRGCKIFIFTGHFGSGKTEAAVNFALKLKEYAENIDIVDLDIVNPFFRTVDFRNLLVKKNINVISSQFAGSNIEIPAVPLNLPIVLNKPDSKTILDVGGDDTGARILHVYKEYIVTQEYIMYCVINIRRPETNSVENIKNTIRRIELSSGIKVSALVNNTNLSNETRVEDIIEGHAVIEEVSKELDIPIAFICAEQKTLEQLPDSIKTDRLVHRLKSVLPWE
jgi:hypothetical protein